MTFITLISFYILSSWTVTLSISLYIYSITILSTNKTELTIYTCFLRPWNGAFRQNTYLLAYIERSYWCSLHDVPFMLFPSWCSLHAVPFMLFPSWCSLHAVPFMLFHSCCSLHAVPFMKFPSWSSLHVVPFMMFPSWCSLQL